MDFFETDKLTALEAKEKAQWIAFAPVVFQTTRILRDSGILQFVESNQGSTFQAIVEKVGLPLYGTRVLVEAALGIGLLTCKEERYYTTKTATFILHDTLTRVNMDFIQDVCYQGMFYLEDSIKTGKPEGLKVFGQWPTIYEGLSKLPPQVQKSWFAFDHYYSDTAFPDVLALIFANKPKRLLDIGGNTGKWALQCLEYDANVEVTIMDLPGQVEMAKEQITKRGFGNRIRFFETNLLDETLPFPKGFDAIWMSQFLDCFSDEEIKSILRRCREALQPGGAVYILEPFWNRQRFQASAFALQQTSLYFTAMANGNSQMYHAGNFIGYVKEAGFTVTEQKDLIGVSHTLLTCKPI
ncbi:methyltransferase domain-containing protein [Fulvivirgaceae bacterium PWU4]|uniref:Methyltransferase domain-containing protein n=1 Tax=Chryseosolibacter histidini TaxID=2782349 RepID=A0AAP2DNN3_9BACT|nr:class I SAM-dependent methyltransferase [Chryseosolibacter histidini]MBT1699720.1 methyltransferase domain-containing protein [Chryseosolibacter histidini]